MADIARSETRNRCTGRMSWSARERMHRVRIRDLMKALEAEIARRGVDVEARVVETAVVAFARWAR